MPRFLQVKGRPGRLVADPHSLLSGLRRYVGQQMLHDAPDGTKFAARHAAVEQVVLAHPDIERAAKAGDLELLGSVEAATVDEATRAFARRGE